MDPCPRTTTIALRHHAGHRPCHAWAAALEGESEGGRGRMEGIEGPFNSCDLREGGTISLLSIRQHHRMQTPHHR
jgi:hypothetical protein